MTDVATLRLTPVPAWRGWLLRRLMLLRGILYRLYRPLTLGVRVLIRDQAGQVLLVRHSYLPGWHLPGGGVARGETIAGAALRELREETGLHGTADSLRIRSVYANFRIGSFDHVALVEVGRWSGTPQGDGREIEAVGFFPVDALPPGTSAATRRRLAEVAGDELPSDEW
jgi:ADP-ribose pyrophosphatase YjhB (NUDIX family)